LQTHRSSDNPASSGQSAVSVTHNPRLHTQNTRRAGIQAFDMEVIGVVSKEKNGGFTLFELMVTIAVAAVIVSFGVPAFKSFIQNNRATTHTNDLVTALNLARSEATRRGAAVTVCSSTDASTCNGDDDWSTGWVVRSAAGDVLRVWPERSGGAGVVSADIDEVRFLARGSLGTAAPTFTVELPDCTGDQLRNVAVNAAGRISVERGACL
ncbi:MAG: GspH/FimT family pseudopilin, partial [Planctomycetaceae bacterium]